MSGRVKAVSCELITDEPQVSIVCVIQFGHELCFVFVFSALFFIILSVCVSYSLVMNSVLFYRVLRVVFHP